MYNKFSRCKLLILFLYYYLIVNIFKIFVDIHNICIFPPNIPEFEVQYSFLIFVSLTLLGKDRSLVWSIITRNIAEKCTENLIRCKNFEHL